MHEATLRIEPGGPYGSATAGTEAAIELWCSDHCDLLDIRNDPADRVVSTLEEQVGIRDQLHDDGRTMVVTEQCLKVERRTVERHLERHSCLLVPPIRYAEGAKFCVILGLNVADLASVYHDLREEASVDVITKRRIEKTSVGPHPLAFARRVPSFSERQRETLALAYDRGYYEIPRGTTTAELAAELGVSRRTAEDHLRRAENKLVDALAEYVRAEPGDGR